MIDSFALQLLHGGSASAPGVLTSEWVKGELIPFLRAFLKYGIGASTLLCLVLYAYERLRFDHDAAVRRAFAILWVAVYLLVVGIVVGGGWDKRYHAKNPFETFYSAPHLFVYASLTLATLLVVCLLIYYRPLFGSPTSLPGGLPASLGLLVAGLGLTAVGGIVLDNIWHTLWGLNETPFSTPHMMIDWGKLITLLGFGSAAIALAEHRAVSGRHRLLVGLLVVIFSITPIMGPFGQQLTTSQVEAVVGILDHPESGLYQAFAIIQEWNMVRTNPISVVLGGLWAGSVIGFLRPYLGRYRALIGVVGLFTVLRAKNNVEFATRMGTVSEGLAAWLPVPLLVAALAVVIGDYLGLEHRSQSVIAGGAFSLVMALVWAPTALGIGLAVPVATVAYVRAQQLGREASHLVAEPTPTGITRIVAVGIAVPVGTGIVDLFVRLGGVGS